MIKKSANSVSFTMAAPQALFSISEKLQKKKIGSSYKYPRLRIQTSEIFVLMFICNGKITGIGRVAKTKSVNMFVAKICQTNAIFNKPADLPPLNKPMALKVSFE